MLAPSAVGIVAFTVLPVAVVAWWSFTRYDLVSSPRYVGVQNYRFALHGDPYLHQAVRNTLWIVVVGLPLQLVVALGLALLLARRDRPSGAARTAVFVPAVLPPVAATLAFGWLLNPGHGLINQLLGALHLPQPLWFQDPTWAKPGLVLLGLWGIGPTVVLYIGGLVRVPRVLYESAALEGAGRWRQFRTITLPMLAPVLLFTLVTGLVGALQYFTEAYVAAQNLTNGDFGGLTGAPQGSTRFYSTWLFEQGFALLHLGYASMLAIILFVAAILAIVALLLVSRRYGALARRS